MYWRFSKVSSERQASNFCPSTQTSLMEWRLMISTRTNHPSENLGREAPQAILPIRGDVTCDTNNLNLLLSHQKSIQTDKIPLLLMQWCHPVLSGPSRSHRFVESGRYCHMLKLAVVTGSLWWRAYVENRSRFETRPPGAMCTWR